MSKILFKSSNNITQNSGTKQKIINIRKPINKIMNIDNFINKNNLSKSPRIDAKISPYSFQKSYVSPTVFSLQSHNSKKKFSNKVSPQRSKQSIIKPTFIYYNSRNKSPKQVNSNISPIKQNNNLLNQNIKKKLYNQRNADIKLPKNKTTEKVENKKYSFHIKKKKKELNVNIKKKINNYKNKIIINKEKLKNMNGKMILNSMSDTDNSYSFRNNSSEANDKVRQEKINNNVINGINDQERNNNLELNNLLLSSNISAKKDNNTNGVNNIFDVGSISHISKNESGSSKGKNIKNVCKSNNNAFENIINEFVEEGKCNNLFDDVKNNGKINNIENDKVNEILKEEKNNNNEHINENINSNGCFEENENLEKIRINNDNKEDSIENININKIINENDIEEDKIEENIANNANDNIEGNEKNRQELNAKEINEEKLELFEKNNENKIEEIKTNNKEEKEYNNDIRKELNEKEENKNKENIENEVGEKEDCKIIKNSNYNYLKDNNIALNNEEGEGKKDEKNNIELIPEVDNKEVSGGNMTNHDKKKESNINDINHNPNEDIDFQNSVSNKKDESSSPKNYPNENINLNIINGLPSNKNQTKNKIMKINNLIKSVEIPIISKKIENFPNGKNDLLQSQESPSIHIVFTKFNNYQKIDIDYNPKSVRRQYQRRRNKSVTTENLQIFYDNSSEEIRANSFTNRSYENLYKKAKLLSDSKKRKSIPLNAKSKQINMSIIKQKLKNIILKEPIKKCKSIKTIKYIFKKWKYILNKKSLSNEKDNNIIINTAVYKAGPNQDNEKMYKLPADDDNTKEEHFGYYDSNITICHPIIITIKNGIFLVINDNIIDKSLFNVNREKEEDMEIFVVKDVKNRNFSFQKNDNCTFAGTY